MDFTIRFSNCLFAVWIRKVIENQINISIALFNMEWMPNSYNTILSLHDTNVSDFVCFFVFWLLLCDSIKIFYSLVFHWILNIPCTILFQCNILFLIEYPLRWTNNMDFSLRSSRIIYLRSEYDRLLKSKSRFSLQYLKLTEYPTATAP